MKCRGSSGLTSIGFWLLATGRFAGWNWCGREMYVGGCALSGYRSPLWLSMSSRYLLLTDIRYCDRRCVAVRKFASPRAWRYCL